MATILERPTCTRGGRHRFVLDWDDLVCKHCGVIDNRMCPVDNPPAPPPSASCSHRYVVDWGERMCCLCGLVGDPIMVGEYREIIPRRHDHYQAHEYVASKIADLAGLEPLEVAPDSWSRQLLLVGTEYEPGEWVIDRPAQTLREALKTARTWHDVYAKMARLNLGGQYRRAGAWMGFPVTVMDWMKNCLFKIIYGSHNRKLKMVYVLYKLTEFAQGDKRVIPLRASQKSLNKSDRVWKDVCQRNGLPYKSTCSDDLAVPWETTTGEICPVAELWTPIPT